MYIYIL